MNQRRNLIENVKGAFVLLGVVLLTGFSKADVATEEEYEERVERYELDIQPENHRKMASWCKRNFPAKYQLHLEQYNRFVFQELVNDGRSDPSLADLKKLYEKAKDLELEPETSEYLKKWGEAQFAIHAKRLKPGDLGMMEKLLVWTQKMEISQIPSAQKLAEDMIKIQADHEEARQALNHLKVEGKWQSVDEFLADLDPRDVKGRIEAHKILAEARNNGPEKSYPSDPFRGMEEISGKSYWMFSPKKSPGAKFFVTENKYKRTKPCRLIISLHGGGTGGFEKARGYAAQGAGWWSGIEGPHVVLCPIATKHVTDSWGTLSNVLEILDACEEICELFNIDRTRIYITGQSMGGGGTTLWYSCFPELTAASCGRAGWFHSGQKQANLLQKPILIIQGEKDEKFRVDSKHSFLKMAEKCNGNVTNISHPEEDHFLLGAKILDDVLPFFDKHVNDIEPDWNVIRHAAKAWLK